VTDQAVSNVPEPVTVVWSRRAKPGREASLSDVIDSIGRAMAKAKGYQGAAVLRPPPGHAAIFSIIAHFSSQSDLDAWTSSEIRGRLLAEAEEVSVGGLHTQQASGLEGWFHLPGSPIVVPPPRYKMAFVTWLAILPLLVIINLLFGPLLAPIPPLLRLVPVTVVVIPLMTWFVMPFMTKAFRFWLYPRSRRSQSESSH
jgi:uncharacterized protein